MQKKFLQGLVKRNPDGFGFFVPDDRTLPDVYIPRHSMTGIMTNDRVLIEMEKEKGGERFRGEIVRVLERKTKKVIGRFQSDGKKAFIKDESRAWGMDLAIDPSQSMGAQSGQLVVVEITHFPDSEKFEGRVQEIIGRPEDPLTDIKRVLIQNHIPHEFSKAALQEAKSFSPEVAESEFAGRRDLRTLHFVTIDGTTAKDFDDAIYVQQSERGFLLYVAIADVSHYVQVGSAIDQDAYERGTSVYFPNFVVPMLPEILSNELCSLRPGIPRLALVAEMHMDFAGEVLGSQFFEAVIQSHARVTYGEAQELIEDQRIEKLEKVREDILRASQLAKILMAKRFKEGSLDLEVPEVEIVVDAEGVPVDMIRSERLFSHRVIEELMLAANVAVAKFFSSRDIPAMYRIHEPPMEDSIALLEKYMQAFGGRIHLSGGGLQKKLTKALREFEGRPEAQVLHILTLRSMNQAKYSADNVGHFGLGFDFYTHFTSPIRRYPDLIVHRVLKNQIQKHSKYRLMSYEDMQTAAMMLSSCEQRSVKAERQFESIKKARFMEKFVGQEFDGVISSVAKFGVFVLLRAYEVDGLIRLDDLGDRYEFDEEHLRLVARRSGHSYSIGDAVKIKVTFVDIEAGQVNFSLAGKTQNRSEQGEAAPDGNFDQGRNKKPGKKRPFEKFRKKEKDKKTKKGRRGQKKR